MYKEIKNGKIMKLLSTILALCIFIQPLAPSIALAQEADDAPKEGSCGAGRHFDGQLKRCVFSTQTLEDRDEARACEGLSGKEYTDCFLNNARSDADEIRDGKGISDKRGKGGRAISNSLVPLTMTLVSGYFLLNNKKTFSSCKATSMYFILGAGIAGITGEAIAYFGHKNRTEDIADKYKNSVDKYNTDEEEGNAQYTSASKNQTLAFDYMIEAEESALKSEKTRRDAHMIAMGLYASATVAAAIEVIKQGWTGGADGYCKIQPNASMKQNLRHKSFINNVALFDKDFEQYSHMVSMTSEEVEESILRKIYSNLLPTLHAAEPQDDDTTPPTSPQTADNDSGGGFNISSIFQFLGPILGFFSKGGGGGAVSTTNSVATAAANKGTQNVIRGSKFDQILSWPATRLGMAVVFGGYSLIVYNDAKHNAEALEKRIEQIKEIKSGFEKSGGAQGVKICEGSNCVGQRADESKTDWDATAGGDEAKISGCINKQNNIDLKCKCLKQKTTSGQNNCSRVSSNLSIKSLGSSSFAKPLMSASNMITSGGLAGSGFDRAGLTNRSMAIRKKIKDLRKQEKYKKAFKKGDKYAAQIHKNNQNVVKKLLPKNFTPPKLAGFSGGNTGNSKLDKIIKDAKKKIVAKNKGPTFKSGGDAAGSNKKESLDFDFDDEEGGIKLDDVASVMEKEFVVTGDINKNSSQNIFKILSNRYQRSALRRLFDEEGKSSVDTADESQINGI